MIPSHFSPIFLLLCFFLGKISAQMSQWAAFPFEQPTFFKTSTGRVNCYFADERRMLSSDTAVLLFQRDVYVQPFDSCLSTLFQNDMYVLPAVQNMLMHGDSVMEVASGQVFAKNGASYLCFDPLASPGDTVSSAWNFGGGSTLRFICTAVYEGDVLGITDSLKRFRAEVLEGGQVLPSAFDSIDFVLSKNHGFVSFCPFYYMKQGQIPQQWSLVGLEKDGNRLGFTNDFLDYVSNYRPGDVFSWHGKPVFWHYWHSCIRDSVKTVEISPDKVKLIVRRYIQEYVSPPYPNVTQDSIIQEYVQEDFVILYTRAEFNSVVDRFRVNALSYHGYTHLHESTVEQNGSFQVSNNLHGNVFDFDRCELVGFACGPYSWSWNTSTGFFSRVWGDVITPAYIYLQRHLRGNQVIYDSQFGGCNQLISSDDEPFTPESMMLWPNPNKGDELYIRTDGAHRPSKQGLQLFDAQGSMVYSLPVESIGDGLWHVSFPKRLEQGLYVVRLNIAGQAGLIGRFLVTW